MPAYLDTLRFKSEEQNRLQEEKREVLAQVKLVQAIQRGKPTKSLEDQIMDLMRTLPPPLRERPWSMTELVQRLVGKYRQRPHAQQVGQALRRLGWRRERRWQKGYDGVRVWMLAEHDHAVRPARSVTALAIKPQAPRLR